MWQTLRKRQTHPSVATYLALLEVGVTFSALHIELALQMPAGIKVHTARIYGQGLLMLTVHYVVGKKSFFDLMQAPAAMVPISELPETLYAEGKRYRCSSSYFRHPRFQHTYREVEDDRVDRVL